MIGLKVKYFDFERRDSFLDSIALSPTATREKSRSFLFFLKVWGGGGGGRGVGGRERRGGSPPTETVWGGSQPRLFIW